MTLAAKRILVVDPNYLAAMLVADEVAAAGANVIGVTSSEQAAVAIIRSCDLDGAVLEAWRGCRVADALAAHHVPFVFGTTCVRDPGVPARHAHVPCIEKPYASGAICRALEGVMRQKVGDCW